MTLPKFSAVEMPILHELVATGGAEQIQFLYVRLLSYFPQISELEIELIRRGELDSWRKLVQRAGRELSDKNLLNRVQGAWTITAKGIEKLELEFPQFEISRTENPEPDHAEIQEMLVRIAETLNFYAQTEYEYYDVIWRENPKSNRLSHVFEVQSKGNIDSAFAKLKRAYSLQRSKIYLVLSSERDLNRARKSLAREFQDLENVLQILTFQQIKTVFQNLNNISQILRELLLK